MNDTTIVLTSSLLVHVGICKPDKERCSAGTRNLYESGHSMSGESSYKYHSSSSSGGSAPHPHPHPPPICGCPDCSKPHSSSSFHGFCSGSSAEADGTEVQESEEYVEEGETDSTTTNPADSEGQTPKRTFNMLAYLLGAGAVAGLVGAALYKKRVSETFAVR